MGDWKAAQRAYFPQEEKMKLYDLCDDYRKLITALLPMVDDELALHKMYVELLYLSGMMDPDKGRKADEGVQE